MIGAVSVVPSYAFLDHDGPIAMAHRGGAHLPANVGLENSMAAFGNAVALGFGYLETDVRATADGVGLAFHDDRLDRVTDASGRIGRLPWSQVRRARIGGREPIPTVEELLDAWPDVRVNLDAKHASSIGPLVRAVLRTNSLDRVCVGSFSDARLAAVRRRLGPRLCTSMGPRPALTLRLAASLPGLAGERLAALLPRDVPVAQLPHTIAGVTFVTPALIETAHRHGIAVQVWTVDDEPAMHTLLDAGADGIITDRPDTLRSVMLERGLWRG